MFRCANREAKVLGESVEKKPKRWAADYAHVIDKEPKKLSDEQNIPKAPVHTNDWRETIFKKNEATRGVSRVVCSHTCACRCCQLSVPRNLFSINILHKLYCTVPSSTRERVGEPFVHRLRRSSLLLSPRPHPGTPARVVQHRGEQPVGPP